ncbi:MAG TPA: hypothetical protein GXX55_05220 [Firmicutes bacterium]|nr:hypothetical protein [Bacillota bacterium]
MFWFSDDLEREELESLARAAGYAGLDILTLALTPGELQVKVLSPLTLPLGEGSEPYHTILLVYGFPGRAGSEGGWSAPALPGLPPSAAHLFDLLAGNLSSQGSLFVAGPPSHLPHFGLELEKRGFTFKYWYAVEWQMETSPAVGGLPTVHLGVLHYVRRLARVTIAKVRIPHQYCRFCGEPLADWGGKKASRNPAGRVISDVWLQLDAWQDRHDWRREVLRRLLSLAAPASSSCPPRALLARLIMPVSAAAAPASRNGGLPERPGTGEVPRDTILLGDILEVIRQLPAESVDLAFADPPYNLDKRYNQYEDDRHDEEYLAWCNQWLQEYVRLLKPGGSLFVLNLPKWAVHHAVFLDGLPEMRRLNWIAWDALSEPRGRVMPAHYALLFYSKGPLPRHFHPGRAQVLPRGYCFRGKCVKERAGKVPAAELNDIWSDVHRIKHRRDRDEHPCQLPLRLMERIISIASDEGDLVFDGFMGTGSTALAARRLGRHYLGIEIDPAYIAIARAKLEQEALQLGLFRGDTLCQACQ